ncbi:hypothetical protein Droror1_Dr00012599 [Drosera rotundifolia]
MYVAAGLTLSEIIVIRVVIVAEHNSTRLGGSNLEWIKTLCACLFPCVGAEHWCRPKEMDKGPIPLLSYPAQMWSGFPGKLPLPFPILQFEDDSFDVANDNAVVVFTGETERHRVLGSNPSKAWSCATVKLTLDEILTGFELFM